MTAEEFVKSMDNLIKRGAEFDARRLAASYSPTVTEETRKVLRRAETTRLLMMYLSPEDIHIPGVTNADEQNALKLVLWSLTAEELDRRIPYDVATSTSDARAG